MRRRISIWGRVRPSVCPSVCPVLFFKVKSTHTRRILCRVSGLVFLSLGDFSMGLLLVFSRRRGLVRISACNLSSCSRFLAAVTKKWAAWDFREEMLLIGCVCTHSAALTPRGALCTGLGWGPPAVFGEDIFIELYIQKKIFLTKLKGLPKLFVTDNLFYS